MTNLKPVDVAIIGGGWSGLAMAKELTTRTAQSVLVLERGIPRKTLDYALDMDELDYAVRLRMMQNIADETITHRHAPAGTAAPVEAGLASVRADDGLCLRHERYSSARASCSCMNARYHAYVCASPSASE